MKEALVIKSTGKFYTIRDSASNETLEAIVRGKFKLKGFKLTNPVAVGDRIGYDQMNDGIAVIKEIKNRNNYVVRQSPRKKHTLHLIASNIDQAILIVTVVEPMLKQGFIDRFLLMTEPYNIPVTLVFHKQDLYQQKDLATYLSFKNIYEKIGYQVLSTSVISGEGLDALRSHLSAKISLIAGQSGVGKSSIVNAMIPDLYLKTNILSGYSGKGQHTTTFAEMFDLPDGGSIIDTPGIKTLSFNHLGVMDIAHNFREFFTLSPHCKYGNCMHRNEPSCAVKNSIANNEISEFRYINYLTLIDEVENQNYWERIKDY